MSKVVYSPYKKLTIGEWTACISTLLTVLFIASIYPWGGSTATPRQPSKAQLFAAAPEERVKQPGREKLIEKLIQRGIFQKLDRTGGYPHLWLSPAFYLLDYDQKQSFVGVVWSYCLVATGNATTLFLNDAKTGKRMGTYSELGLDLN